MKTHLDLNVWKASTNLAITIYKVTNHFPKEELYGLTSQLRRAAISVPSNISEGAGRTRKAEFIRFLDIAGGSLSELETQLFISKEIGYLPAEKYLSIIGETKTIRAQISGLKRYLYSQSNYHSPSP